MVKARKFIYKSHFDGFPKESDLELVEEELPTLTEGQFLAEAIYFSVEPYQRCYTSELPLGATAIGFQVAKVTESKNDKYPVGTHIKGHFGWRSHTISEGQQRDMVEILSNYNGLPFSYSLGVFGMIGNTAYFGLLEICDPKPGETVIISGAAGSVGIIAGQIAKIKGCVVIGITGSEEKGRWLVEELNFDSFVNYKADDFEARLIEATPDGVDCYFDNVGGEISSSVLNRMNTYGRISVCGAITGYNSNTPPKASIVQDVLFRKELRMEGFLVMRWVKRWAEGHAQLKEWIKEGKLKYHETITEGFDKLPQVLIGMFNGVNKGKTIVKV